MSLFTEAQPKQNGHGNAHALHLPSPVVAALSPSTYLLSHLQRETPVRPSARKPYAFQPVSTTSSSLTHCAGSAVTRYGSTAVVCGIQPEILLTSSIADPGHYAYTRNIEVPASRSHIQRAQSIEALSQLQLLVPNIDLATGCHKDHIPGQAPNALAQSLAHRLYRLLLSTDLIDIQDLVITRIKRSLDDEDAAQADGSELEVVGFFTLHIQLTVLSMDGTQALLPALWITLMAALRDLRLPEARWDDENDSIVCNSSVARSRRLWLRCCPFVCVWGVFGAQATHHGAHAGNESSPTDRKARRWILPDPDSFEENVCGEFITMVIDCTPGNKDDKPGRLKIMRVEKSGGGSVERQDLKDLARSAEARWKELRAALPLQTT